MGMVVVGNQRKGQTCDDQGNVVQVNAEDRGRTVSVTRPSSDSASSHSAASGSVNSKVVQNELLEKSSSWELLPEHEKEQEALTFLQKRLSVTPQQLEQNLGDIVSLLKK